MKWSAAGDRWHPIQTILACEAGKDVCVEKPIGVTVAEGRATVRAARRYDRVVQAGTRQRSEKRFQPAAAKSAQPVFRSSAATWQGGPGHNSFTVDASGADVMVYHARSYRDIAGDPLHDPNRHTRAQYVRWRADGTPDFGEPVADGVAAAVLLRVGQ